MVNIRQAILHDDVKAFLEALQTHQTGVEGVLDNVFPIITYMIRKQRMQLLQVFVRVYPRYRRFVINRALTMGEERVVEALLESGFEVSEISNLGILSTLYKNPDLVEWLVQRGLDVQSPSLLYQSVQFAPRVVAWLLLHGANPNTQPSSLERAVFEGKVQTVKLLLDAGARVPRFVFRQPLAPTMFKLLAMVSQ